MKTNYLKLFSCIIALSFLVACGDSDEPELSENEILDDSGLVIILEWTTGGSATKAVEDVDLDLTLLVGDEEVDDSSWSTSFEEVELSGLLADAEYRVQIVAYRTDAASDFTLYVEGKASNTTLEYTGSFSAADGDNEASFPDFVKIKKEGKKYTVLK